MPSIGRGELEVMARMHERWVKHKGDDWRDCRADFSGVKIEDTDFSGLDFSGAKFRDVRLTRCDLTGAAFDGALMWCNKFRECVLDGARFRRVRFLSSEMYRCHAAGADFSRAVMPDMYLSEGDFSRAVFSRARAVGMTADDVDFSWADMSGAKFTRSSLSQCKFSHAGMDGFNAKGAVVVNCSFDSADGLDVPEVCPSEGEFTAWKRCGHYIVKLSVPADARRTAFFGPQCRCDKAEVLEIQNLAGDKSVLTEVASDRDPSFMYRMGGTVIADGFDLSPWNTCAAGIHCYMSRAAAVMRRNW